MRDFTGLEQETAAVQLAFLLTDLTTATTFLDVAGTTRKAATRVRNIAHANTAHEAVTKFAQRVRMTLEQSSDITQRLDLLRGRITKMEQETPQ